jgi:hypothetical protein
MLSQEFAWAAPGVIAFILSMPTAVATVTTMLGRSTATFPPGRGQRGPTVQNNLPRTLQTRTLNANRAIPR